MGNTISAVQTSNNPLTDIVLGTSLTVPESSSQRQTCPVVHTNPPQVQGQSPIEASSTSCDQRNIDSIPGVQDFPHSELPLEMRNSIPTTYDLDLKESVNQESGSVMIGDIDLSVKQPDSSKCPVDHSKYANDASSVTSEISGKCPVNHIDQNVSKNAEVAKKKLIIPTECPMNADYVPPQQQDGDSSCSTSVQEAPSATHPGPAHQLGNKFGAELAGKFVDLSQLNNEGPPNQVPDAEQPFSLPTKRQVSSIPMGATENNWLYPSPQMFYNAMKRKGTDPKDDGVDNPEIMDQIVNIHNVQNEQAWAEVKLWEEMLHPECSNPKLVSFSGNAKKISPRARIRSLMGYELPFDRHDWVVDRCGQKVRYVIDYYDGDLNPETHEFSTMDVRPAMDTPSNVWDRCKVAWWRLTAKDQKDE